MILTFWLFSGALRAPEFSAMAPEKSNFAIGRKKAPKKSPGATVLDKVMFSLALSSFLDFCKN